MGIKCPKCQLGNPGDTVYCGRCASPLKHFEEIEVMIMEKGEDKVLY